MNTHDRCPYCDLCYIGNHLESCAKEAQKDAADLAGDTLFRDRAMRAGRIARTYADLAEYRPLIRHFFYICPNCLFDAIYFGSVPDVCPECAIGPILRADDVSAVLAGIGH